MITTSITQTLQKMNKYKKFQNSKKQRDVFPENINRLTELINIPVVKSLRLRNRQLLDLITQYEAVKKFSDDDIGETGNGQDKPASYPSK